MSDTAIAAGALHAPRSEEGVWGFSRAQLGALVVMVVFLAVAPFVLYPVFLMKLLCFALFASAFNLLIGFTGLLSFGHAAFFGSAGYVAGNALKNWGMPVELGILLGVAAAALVGFAGYEVRHHREAALSSGRAEAENLARMMSEHVQHVLDSADRTLTLAKLVHEHFDLRPKGIVQMLDLLRPVYEKTAAYGHFGRDDLDLPWERTDRADQLKSIAS